MSRANIKIIYSTNPSRRHIKSIYQLKILSAILVFIILIYPDTKLQSQTLADSVKQELRNELIVLNRYGNERIKLRSPKYDIEKLSADNTNESDSTLYKLIDLEYRKFYSAEDLSLGGKNVYIYKLSTEEIKGIRLQKYQIAQPFGMGEKTFEANLDALENMSVSEKILMSEAMDQLNFEHPFRLGLYWTRVFELSRLTPEIRSFALNAPLYSIHRGEKVFIRNTYCHSMELVQKLGEVFDQVTIEFVIIKEK